MSTEQQGPSTEALVEELMGLVDAYADLVATDLGTHHSAGVRGKAKDALEARLREVLCQDPLVHPTEPLVERPEAADEELWGPHLCIAPACPKDCDSCNHAISPKTEREYAIRYAWLRERLHGADFAYGSPPVCVIAFVWPTDARIGADLDTSIDDVLAASGNGSGE